MYTHAHLHNTSIQKHCHNKQRTVLAQVRTITNLHTSARSEECFKLGYTIFANLKHKQSCHVYGTRLKRKRRKKTLFSTGSLRHLIMYNHVGLQVTLPIKSFMTNCTFKWLLSSMNHHVTFQIISSEKAL